MASLRQPRAPAPPRPLLFLLLSLASWAPGCAVQQRHRAPRYMIATFPLEAAVRYTTLQEGGKWEPLVTTGLSRPMALCVDAIHQHIYIADEMAKEVVAYRFYILPSGGLVTDGQRRAVVRRVAARGLYADASGALFVAGSFEPDPKLLPPGTPIQPFEAVFKSTAAQIAHNFATGMYLEPTELWSRANTVSANAPDTPQLYAPSCLSGDASTLFWGNGARPDDAAGSIVRGGSVVPSSRPADTLRPMANNVDAVAAMVLTPMYVFYAGGGKVYGVPRHKEDTTCGDGDVLCPAVLAQNSEELKPSAMQWDGDGTVFMAEPSLGAVLGFSAGSLSQHLITKVMDASGVWGLAYYAPTSGSPRRLGGAMSAVFALAAALSQCWGFM